MCRSHHHHERRRDRVADRPGTALRASDQEREQTTARLQSAAAEGRLTISELEERLQRAWAARTRGQLIGLTHDLGGGTGEQTRGHWLRHPTIIWAVLIGLWLLGSTVSRALGL